MAPKPVPTQPAADALARIAAAEELQRRAVLTQVLAQVSHETLEADNLETLLERLVELLAEQLPLAIASIILLDEEQTKFVKEVWAGEIDLEMPTGDPWPITLGAAGRCARTGMPQLLLDVAHDPDYVAGNRRVRSELLVPIRYRDRIHGVLNLESIRTDVFTLEAQRVFVAIAEQIAGAIRLAQVVRQLEETRGELERLSAIDGLTGIANRRTFEARLEGEWRRLSRERRQLAVLRVDADCFERLNDARGATHGDACLRRLAQLAAGVARRAGDLVARWDGAEIAILLPGIALGEASRIAERLRQAVEAEAMEHPASTVAPVVTVSVGVAAVRPSMGRPAAELVAAAGAALRAAKTEGRNRIVSRRLPDP